MGLWDDIKESAKEFNRSDEYTDEEAQQVCKKLRQDIEPGKLRERIGANVPLDYLDDDEQVIYYLNGLDLDVDDDDEGFQSAFVVTDKKLVFLARSMTGKNSQYTVYYQDVIGVSVQTRLTAQVQIETAGHSYKISAGVRHETVEEAVEYIRKRKQDANSEQKTAENEGALDKLDKLADLRDKGAISEEEYEEQKEKLLDEV